MGPKLSRFEYDNFGLPPEIIDEIVKFFTPFDLLRCRKVCKDWNERTLPIIESQLVFLVDYSDVDSRTTVLTSSTSASWRNFKFTLFVENQIFENDQFWKIRHEHISSLKFYSTQIICSNERISKDVFCPNLRFLSVVDCDEYFRDFGSASPLQDVFHMKNLDSLDLSSNKYLTDRIVLGILLETKCLKSLNLANTTLNFIDVIVKRFYPGAMKPLRDDARRVQFSDFVFTFEILHFAYFSTPKAQQLRELVLDQTDFTSSSLLKICDEKVFKWESFSIQNCRNVDGASLEHFLNKQQSLTKLSIDNVFGTNELLSRALNPLKYLKVLSLRCIQNFDMNIVQDLPPIKELNIIAKASTVQIRENINISRLAENLRVLQLTGDLDPFYGSTSELEPVTTGILSSAVMMLRNISKLDLSLCNRTVTDGVTQAIFTSCRSLTHLNLSNCQLITDFGFAGKFLGSYDENVKSNHDLEDSTLRSGWDLARRSFPPRPCVTDLKGLKFLDLKNCTRLNRATFEEAIKFQFLESLDISGTRVKGSGIDAILQNCTSLVKLRTFQQHPRLITRRRTEYIGQ